MLNNLHIKDLAVVEELHLDCENGLIVLTGETGAGKSILLTALNLALGDRADTAFIRPGADRAEIHLQFDLHDAPEARDWLAQQELLDDPDTCLIRRVLTQDGRSRAFINQRPATLLALQELASRLVEIHGQHAHLQLLLPQEQRRLLDESAGNQALLKEIHGVHRDWQKLTEQLDALHRQMQEGNAREELLRYQISELDQHEVDNLDYAQLSDEHALQANLGKILGTSQEQLTALYEDERQSVNAMLVQASAALRELGQLEPDFIAIANLLNEAQILVKEASQDLRRSIEKLEPDPARLEWLDRKLGDLHRLARKHQVAAPELKEHLSALRAELQALEHSGTSVAELQTRVQGLAEQYRELASQLTQKRMDAAQQLQTRITQLIRELGMPQGNFQVQIITPNDALPTAHGLDRIEFQVSANPGHPPRALTRVASGGELSRISLAIQVAATDVKSIPTLIFDEVDTGIGGGVAETVGQKLRLLGSERQVFCVTHLHQVAAQGHHHWLVEKISEANNTRTQVRSLDAQQRTQEIARMLGGVRITEQTLAHAAELLSSAGSE